MTENETEFSILLKRTVVDCSASSNTITCDVEDSDSLSFLQILGLTVDGGNVRFASENMYINQTGAETDSSAAIVQGQGNSEENILSCAGWRANRCGELYNDKNFSCDVGKGTTAMSNEMYDLPPGTVSSGSVGKCRDLSELTYCSGDQIPDESMSKCVTRPGALAVPAASIAPIVIIIIAVFCLAFVVYLIFRVKRSKKPVFNTRARSVQRIVRLRHCRSIAAEILENDESKLKATMENVCTEAGVDVIQVNDIVMNAANRAVSNWAQETAPGVLSRSIMHIMQREMQNSPSVTAGLNLSVQAINSSPPPPTPEALLQDMQQSLFLITCNPLHYRGSAWPFPQSRIILDRLFCVQDNPSGEEDASITAVRIIYKRAVLSQSAKFRTPLLSGRVDDINNDEMLAPILQSLLGMAQSYEGMAEVQLSTGRPLQLLCDTSHIEKAFKSFPMHLHKAALTSKSPLGSTVAAARKLCLLTLSCGRSVAQKMADEYNTIAARLGIAHGDKNLGPALVLQQPELVFQAAMRRIRLLALPKLQPLVGLDTAEQLLQAAERLLLPVIVATVSGYGHNLTFTPALVEDQEDSIPVTTAETNIQRLNTLLCAPGGVEDGAEVMGYITRGLQIIIMPAINFGVKSQRVSIPVTIYTKSRM